MALVTAIHLRGTRASQPAAATANAGYLYCVTDESDIIERSSGSVWEAYSPAANAGTVTHTGTLTAHALIVGNGTVDVTALAGLGTTTQVLHGNASADPAFSAIVTADLPANQIIAGIVFVIDGAGSAITTGVKGFLQIPFACTIASWTILSTDASATSGSIVIDIWKDVIANYPPTVADTIINTGAGGTKPTLTTATNATSSTLTSWTTSISAGDVLGFNVDSITTVTRITLQLAVNKT